jgi:hypothetical protein
LQSFLIKASKPQKNSYENGKISKEGQMKEKERNAIEKNEIDEKRAPAYEPPEIITYSSEQIVEKIGPAQTCTPSVTCATL